MVGLAKGCDQLGVEALAFLLGHGTKVPTASRQPDPEGAAVIGVALADHEIGVLAELHEPRDRLLGEPGSRGELAKAKAILIEERDEDRSERRPDVAIAAGSEALHEQLVEALRGLREQKADVVRGQR